MRKASLIYDVERLLFGVRRNIIKKFKTIVFFEKI